MDATGRTVYAKHALVLFSVSNGVAFIAGSCLTFCNKIIILSNDLLVIVTNSILRIIYRHKKN